MGLEQTTIKGNHFTFLIMTISALTSTAIKILVGWIILEKIPLWLNLQGIVSKIIKAIGIFVIISALLEWVN